MKVVFIIFLCGLSTLQNLTCKHVEAIADIDLIPDDHLLWERRDGLPQKRKTTKKQGDQFGCKHRTNCQGLRWILLQNTISLPLTKTKPKIISKNSHTKLIAPKLKPNCAEIKCPSVEDPICVKIKQGKQNLRILHIVMVNKCEMEYLKCHQGLEAAIVPMKNCNFNQKKQRASTTSATSRRRKREIFVNISTEKSVTIQANTTVKPAASQNTTKETKKSILRKDKSNKNKNADSDAKPKSATIHSNTTVKPAESQNTTKETQKSILRRKKSKKRNKKSESDDGIKVLIEKPIGQLRRGKGNKLSRAEKPKIEVSIQGQKVLKGVPKKGNKEGLFDAKMFGKSMFTDSQELKIGNRKGVVYSDNHKLKKTVVSSKTDREDKELKSDIDKVENKVSVESQFLSEKLLGTDRDEGPMFSDGKSDKILGDKMFDEKMFSDSRDEASGGNRDDDDTDSGGNKDDDDAGSEGNRDDDDAASAGNRGDDDDDAAFGSPLLKSDGKEGQMFSDGKSDKMFSDGEKSEKMFDERSDGGAFDVMFDEAMFTDGKKKDDGGDSRSDRSDSKSDKSDNKSDKGDRSKNKSDRSDSNDKKSDRSDRGDISREDPQSANADKEDNAQNSKSDGPMFSDGKSDGVFEEKMFQKPMFSKGQNSVDYGDEESKNPGGDKSDDSTKSGSSRDDDATKTGGDRDDDSMKTGGDRDDDVAESGSNREDGDAAKYGSERETLIKMIDDTKNFKNDYDQLDPVDEEQYEANCPTVCPARAKMLCARCKDGVYRTFMSVCHMRKFTCEHPGEKLELIARYPCAMSAPYNKMSPQGLIQEPLDRDEIQIMLDKKGGGVFPMPLN